MSNKPPRKPRVTFTTEQRLEYAKLKVNEGYTNRQVREISGAGETAVLRWKKQYLQEINGIEPASGKKH